MFKPSDVSIALEISLLGGFTLRAGGRDIVVSRKARALLAYLAASPDRSVPRETVADLLWTESGAARHSLRQTLLELRRIFTAEGVSPLRTENATLCLVPGHVRVDTHALRQFAGAASVVDLVEVGRLYRGPFLDGFPPITTDFDAWLEQERTTWTEQAATALGRAVDMHLAAGDPERAVTLGERALEIDPLREDNHRRLMQGFLAGGRRADAIRQYHNCVSVLRRGLDVPPSEQTLTLFRQIRAGNGTAPGPVAATAKVQETPRATREPAFNVVKFPSPGFFEPAPDASGFSDTRRNPEPRPRDGPPWIAVLPLRGLGPDPVPDYFAAGLVDDIVSMLASLRELVVISSGSCLMFRDQPTDLHRVRAELGVRYVLSGTILRAGRHLRTHVELANAETGEVLWKHRYDTVDTELFEAQDDIAQRVVTTLVPRIHQAEMRRIQGKPPESMTAYDLVLQARDLTYRLEQTSFEQAGSMLQRAITLDPSYAASHAASAQWYSLRLGQGWSPNPSVDTQALEMAARCAVSRDVGNARALAMLGHNRTILNRDYGQAIELLDRALEEAPNDAESLMWSSPTFAFIGEKSESIRRAELAIALAPHDPFSFRFQHFLCNAHYWGGDCEAAAQWGLRSVRANSNYTSNLRLTAASLVALGRKAEARELADKVIELQPGFRVAATVSRHASQDAVALESYARRLVEAGLPP